MQYQNMTDQWSCQQLISRAQKNSYGLEKDLAIVDMCIAWLSETRPRDPVVTALQEVVRDSIIERHDYN